MFAKSRSRNDRELLRVFGNRLRKAQIATGASLARLVGAEIANSS
jgi:hypothetical protein